MTKKLASLLVLLCVILITSCAGQNSELADFIGSDTESGLGGLTLYFRAELGQKESELAKASYLGYGEDSLYAEMAKERVQKVETDLDCHIELSTALTDMNNIVYLLASGGGDLDAIIEPEYWGGSDAKRLGAFLPMSTVSSYIDIYNSEKWGAPNKLEIFAWDGEIYGVTPAYWPECQITCSDFLLVCNSEYLSSKGFDDPREYHENGIWTLDKFEETIKAYTNEDSNGDPVYGFSANKRHLYEMLCKYYGVDWAEKDDSGNWVAGALTANGLLAAEKCREMIAGDLNPYCYINSVGEQVDMWLSDHVAMAMLHAFSSIKNTAEIPYSDKEYSILPFPSQDGKTVFGQYERSIQAIFITSWTSNYQEAARVLSAIYEPFEGYETEDELKAQYNSYTFFDSRDTDVLFELMNNVKYLFHNEGINDLDLSLTDALLTKDATQVLDTYKNSINTLVEKEIIPVKETMEELFPGYND